MKHITLLDTDGVYRSELISILREIDVQYTVVDNYNPSTVYESDLVIFVSKYDLVYRSSAIRDTNERFLCIMYDIPIEKEDRLYKDIYSNHMLYYCIRKIDDEIRYELKLTINGAIDSFNRRLGKRRKALPFN